jgi:RNA polymerase sigma-70 factor (ECF subfamily)
MDGCDHELLERYGRGDVAALGNLVEKYRRPLFAFILNMTGGQGDAEEVFQEVWFRVIRKVGSCRQENFFGWVVRIAHNLIVDRSRRRRPEMSLDQEDEDGTALGATVEGAGPHPAREAEARDLGRRIAEAVDRLPIEQKEVLVLRTKADLSFKEIARIQKVSINTALARMQYALAKLRPILREEYRALSR